jgi:hypothetical protein
MHAQKATNTKRERNTDKETLKCIRDQVSTLTRILLVVSPKHVTAQHLQVEIN